jgi:DNA invertase Pin-like site-specific DNA recombinase
MQVAAIYARYSTDAQRETSIDDQVRRCREVAEKNGYTVDDALIFTDAALTGTEKGIHKRAGYHAMLAAWDHNRFNALVVDELPRLARDAVEMAKLQKKIEVTGIRLLSADGTDTQNPNWQLQFQIISALGQHFVRETRHRVLRGMLGQLERGYMIAAPAFGYDMKQVLDENGEPLGTHWTINLEQAEIVRKMYAMRRHGVAFAEIARYLNQSGVKPPRKSRKTGGDGYWRQSSVFRMLSNTIYRGVFVWNGSIFSRAKAKKEGRTLVEVEYLRPQLRLVDDETWNICNEGKVSRTARGGGKHRYAGLVTCGVCEATLTVSSPRNKARTLYCAQCLLARRVGARDIGSGYTASSGYDALIQHLLERVLVGDVFVEFRNRLRERLQGGGDAELRLLKQKVEEADKACQRLSRVLAQVEGNEHLEQQCALTCSLHKQLLAQLREFEDGLARQDRSSIEKQLEVTPASLVHRLLSDKAPPERVRAVLSRLFPRIVALGKTSRFVSNFEVTMAPGVVLAELAGTAVLDEMVMTRRFRVTAGPARPVRWIVEEIFE